MKQRIESALPGFIGVREFFRRLGTSFESVPLETVDIDRFRKGILAISGNPRDYLETSVWAWFATARAREMRRYSDGTRLVRFGVREICDDLSLSESERQLAIAFDADGSMKSYTLIDGTGLLDDEDEIEIYCSGHGGGKLLRRVSDGWARLHEHIREMDEDEFFVVSDKRYAGMSFFQAIGERHDGELRYLVEYCIRDFVWHFTAERMVSRDELERLVEVFREGGYPALQEAIGWRRMNVDGYWLNYKKSVCIDVWLKAAGMRAQAEGDTTTAARYFGLLEGIETGRDPLSVDVDMASALGPLEQIKRTASDGDLFTAVEQKRMREFAELYSRSHGAYP